MTILPLPPSAVRTLASSQVISTPESVVKELIDNSLDAGATFIAVDLSANGLDVIQVHDNGLGVPAEDRLLLCRRHCTNKIADFADLRFIGPQSLGFRGDALASIAELASILTITTRVKGELTATRLNIGRDGEVAGHCKTSHPIGTTVRVQDFLSPLPVRKQTALNSSLSHIHAMQRFLRAYAFARPSVRLSLRILKSPNGKGNWMYVPRANAEPEDAALKIVGIECATSCQWAVYQIEGYELHAFLPRPGVLPGTISGQGCFISIDARPVSPRRGLLKQIVALFRHRLRTSTHAMQGVKDPFLWLSVTCPSESYDANIEPAKDDVVFADGDVLLAAMIGLLETVYPVPRVSFPSVYPAITSIPDSAQAECDENNVSQSANKRHEFREQEISFDDADNVYGSLLTSEYDFEDENLSNIEVSNPWILAKVFTSTHNYRKPDIDSCMVSSSPLQEQGESRLNSEAEIRDKRTNPRARPLPNSKLSSLTGKPAHRERLWGEKFQLSQSHFASGGGQSARDDGPRRTCGRKTSKPVETQQLDSSVLDRPLAQVRTQNDSPETTASELDPSGDSPSFVKVPRRGCMSLARPIKISKISSTATNSSIVTEPQPHSGLSVMHHGQNVCQMFNSNRTGKQDQMFQLQPITRVSGDPCNKPIQPNGSILDAGLFENEYNLLRDMPVSNKRRQGMGGDSQEFNFDQNDTSTSPSRSVSPPEEDSMTTNQHLQHISHSVSASATSLDVLATQSNDLYMSFAHITINVWACSSTSSLREPAPEESEIDDWSSRLGRLLGLRGVNGGHLREQTQLKEQIMASLASIQPSA